MKNRHCRLSAMGIVTTLGDTKQSNWDNLFSAQPLPLTEWPKLLNERKFGVRDVKTELHEIPSHLKQYDCRNNALALTAFQQMETEVQELLKTVNASRVGVIMGTSTSGILATEEAFLFRENHGDFPDDYHYAQHEMNGVADFIAEYAGVTGPAYTISTACSSSAKVFASGRSLLEMDICDAVIVGGADSLCGLVVNGFSSLEVLAPEITNPISDNRKGINLGEGACIFLMEKKAGGIQLIGVGESCDAHHMSSPDPEGKGAQTAMQNAIADAEIVPEKIQYLNLHGTGTRLNDGMEVFAVQNTFSEIPYCSSTKPLTGHCLGAAGSIEAGICWLSLTSWDASEKTLQMPPHHWDEKQDPDLPKLKLVIPNQKLPANESINMMSTSFGFGGNNFSLILNRQFD